MALVDATAIAVERCYNHLVAEQNSLDYDSENMIVVDATIAWLHNPFDFVQLSFAVSVEHEDMI